MPSTAPTPRTTIRRKANRGHYDRTTVYAIIDDAFLCTVAFSDDGSVHCLPMACWREGDHLYLHGARNSRLIQALSRQECAVSIAHVDGLVLARSAMHHSMNYRSVAIYGRCEVVAAEADKRTALAAFLEHVSPGRKARVRPPSAAELSGTTVLRLPLSEAAAKIRNWGVEDDADDLAIPVWAGVLPLGRQVGRALPEPGCANYPPPALAAALEQAGATT